jgi:hypothetical protein
MTTRRRRTLVAVLAGVLVAVALLVASPWVAVLIFVAYMALLTAKRSRL